MVDPAAGRDDAVAVTVAELVDRGSQVSARRPCRAPAVDYELKKAIRERLPDAWIAYLPAGMNLRDAIDAALRSTSAPRTPRYDRLTGGRRSAAAPAGRWDRWKRLLEPVTGFWVVVVGVGASMTSVAGDNSLVKRLTGTIPIAVGMVAIFFHVMLAVFRMASMSVRSEPTDDDLARALLSDLRHDWWRLTVFRANDVPQQLPVLLVGASEGDPPALLRAYRWRLRRPSAVLVSDCRALRERRQRRWLAFLMRYVNALPRWLLSEVLLPAKARRRARHLLCYGMVALLAAGLLYLDRSLGQPYCLGRGSDVKDEVTIDGDEWIGYRICLDKADLGRETWNRAVGQLVGHLAVHRPGPEDNRNLFDVNLIYRENKRVERLAERRRGLATVAVVTSLTTREQSRSLRSVVAEREGLAGAYAAQVRVNADRNPRMPYLRLAVVNAGDLTSGLDRRTVQNHLDELKDKLAELTRDQPLLIAAIVTLNSTDPVRAALRDSLGKDEVAMISPTMSADGFAAGFDAKEPVFFQVSSVNDDQVELIRQYAKVKEKKLIYYYPVDREGKFDAEDRYVQTMFCDVWRRRSPPPGTRGSKPCPAVPPSEQETYSDIELRPWSQGESAEEFRKTACPTEGITATSRGKSESDPRRPALLFFGGRYTDVAAFTQLVQVSCAPHQPEVAVADSATRFLADGELAGLVPHRTRVLIASRGPALTCTTLAAGPATALSPYDQGRRDDFADDVRRTLHRCGAGSDPEADRRLAGGWALVNYDSVLMIRDALLRVGLHRLTPATEMRGLVLGCLRGSPICPSASFPGGYGTITMKNGLGRRTVFLLDVPDLATAFAAASINPIYVCAPPGDPSKACLFEPF